MFVLRAFVNERLTAAAEEILGAVEHTVADYQSQVSRLKKEVGSLRRQLDILQPVLKIPRTDIQEVTVPESEELVLPEWHHCEQAIQTNNPSLAWEDPPAPIPTKEELKDAETTEEQAEPELTRIKEEEQHLSISEGLEGHDVIQLVLHPDPDFCPPLSSDCATAPSGSNGKYTMARKGPRIGPNTKKPRRARMKEVKPAEVHFRNAPIHHHGANHHCRTCGKFYLTASALKKHVRVHTQDAHPLCGLCEQQFESREHLIVHLSTHIGAKYCHICGQCFDKDQDLSGHIDGHTGKKPFKCFICVKSFVRRENLAQHIRSHTGEKPYQCIYCGKGFSQKPNMKRHMRIHTGEKPYYCTVCAEPFPSKQQVTVHMTCHTDFSEKQRLYRARRDADPLRRQKYLERAAESQRQYRARRDTDPFRRQRYLEGEKERWRKNRGIGKRRVIGELSEREQNRKREEWRVARFRSRTREAATGLTVTQPADTGLAPQAGGSNLVETSCTTYTSAPVADAVDPANPWASMLSRRPCYW